jgi:tetratricopeptide (TPR) repeat protein
MRSVVLVLLILLCCLTPTLRAEVLPAELAFADSLAARGDHFRAATEYQRFLFVQPDSPLAARGRLSLAGELIALEDWQAADQILQELLRLHPLSPEAFKAQHLLADSAYDRGDFGLARHRYRRLLAHPDTEAQNYGRRRIGWTYLEQDRPDQALQSFSLLPAEETESFRQAVASYQALELKSPRLAATLSAVVPGSGQLYVGRVRQAALAFVLNGIFILGTFEAFQNENYVVGGILLFLEAGWYGGNIYNAVNNTHKHNQRLKQNYLQQMKSDLQWRFGWLQGQPGLLLSGRF